MINTFDITTELKKLPHRPGVYIMKDENDVVLYVGKANNLYNRVRSYFQESAHTKARRLAKKTNHFEYVVTDTENEAFILENNLIKFHHPKFNIRLKDDKAYPYIKITEERLPRILYSNQRGKDKAKYYGPFVSRSRVKELLELIHKLWPLRKCSKRFPRDFDKERPCLNHHIGQCRAPCVRLLDEETYAQHMVEAEQFIQGKTEGISKRLTADMQAASMAMEFEKAAELRDTINTLNLLMEKQKVETGKDDRDVLAIARQEQEALVQIFFIRDGKLTGREHFLLNVTTGEIEIEIDAEAEVTGQAHNDETNETNEATETAENVESVESEIMAAFIKQFYSEAAFIPKELALSVSPIEKNSIALWLSGLAGRQVSITIPQKGKKRDMVKLAQTNAELTISHFGAHIKRDLERNQLALKEIEQALGIDFALTRIEAYDISNIQGYESVGSMIVFENGKAKNSDYRKFRLKAVFGPDDYAGMEEILTRRLARYKESDSAFAKLPNIIFVDGGKGQITVAKKALEKANLFVPVCGMVKDERHRTRGLLYNGVEVTLPRSGEGFKLVTRIQDEVHRFALEYHKKLRSDSQVRSVLDDIQGIGATRRKELLKHFKSIDAIRLADVESLTLAPSMNKKTAQAVYDYFQESHHLQEEN